MVYDNVVKVSVTRAVDKVKNKYPILNDFEINFTLTETKGASLSLKDKKAEIQIGKRNPMELIEAIAMHQVYYLVLGINPDHFEESTPNSLQPYIKTNVTILNKIKQDFPNMASLINSSTRAGKSL